MRPFLLMFPLLACLAACVSESSSFRSPDGKQVSVCSASAFGLLSMSLALNAYSECRDAYLSAGYTEVKINDSRDQPTETPQGAPPGTAYALPNGGGTVH